MTLSPSQTDAFERDRGRFARYQELRDFYAGVQWAGKPRRGETRMIANYARALVRKVVSYALPDPVGFSVPAPVLTDEVGQSGVGQSVRTVSPLADLPTDRLTDSVLLRAQRLAALGVPLAAEGAAAKSCRNRCAKKNDCNDKKDKKAKRKCKARCAKQCRDGGPCTPKPPQAPCASSRECCREATRRVCGTNFSGEANVCCGTEGADCEAGADCCVGHCCVQQFSGGQLVSSTCFPEPCG